MKWNVYYYNINKQKVESYNIFEHRKFVYYVGKALQECEEKEIFIERLKRELSYYFWSKSEWELIISPWCGNKYPEELKIDVYDQVMLNWDIFAEYVWENREYVKESAWFTCE